GARKFQFVANSATDVKIKYVSETDMDSQILEEFGRILTLKGAETATKTTAKRVAELPADQSTGKHRLVLLS
ncbi:MAG: hypothetical protein ACI9MB_002265, partial [Verrucomicrobiales bacterium]